MFQKMKRKFATSWHCERLTAAADGGHGTSDISLIKIETDAPPQTSLHLLYTNKQRKGRKKSHAEFLSHQHTDRRARAGGVLGVRERKEQLFHGGYRSITKNVARDMWVQVRWTGDGPLPQRATYRICQTGGERWQEMKNVIKP